MICYESNSKQQKRLEANGLMHNDVLLCCDYKLPACFASICGGSTITIVVEHAVVAHLEQIERAQDVGGEK